MILDTQSPPAKALLDGLDFSTGRSSSNSCVKIEFDLKRVGEPNSLRILLGVSRVGVSERVTSDSYLMGDPIPLLECSSAFSISEVVPKIYEVVSMVGFIITKGT